MNVFLKLATVQALAHTLVPPQSPSSVTQRAGGFASNLLVVRQNRTATNMTYVLGASLVMYFRFKCGILLSLLFVFAVLLRYITRNMMTF